MRLYPYIGQSLKLEALPTVYRKPFLSPRTARQQDIFAGLCLLNAM